MDRIPSIIAVAMLGLAVWAGLAPRDPHAIPNPDPSHTHADFAVWVNGEQMDFSAPELMSETESGETDADHEAHGHKHHPHLHLHDGIGHVIHRHKPGLSLREFFASLQLNIVGLCYTSFMPLSDGQLCGETPFRMFVNGTEMPLDLDYAFADLDRILMTNAATDAEIADQLQHLTDDACLYSKRCPWRGEPPAENCIADPAVPCVE